MLPPARPAQLSQPLMSAGTTSPIPLLSSSAKRSLRLLLVEDHEATLQVLQRLLTRDGHQVTPARDVAEALAAAEANTFDLIISDLGLPDGTGTDLMQRLRANYGLRGIALSGYGMEDDLARSREAGFIAHLIKPVDFPQLRRALEALV
jgi:CheY-like chemotaxis protein